MIHKNGEGVVITGMAASTCCGLGIAKLFSRLGQKLYSQNEAADDGQGFFRKLGEFGHDIAGLERQTRTDNELTRHLLEALDYDNLYSDLRGIQGGLEYIADVIRNHH